MSVPTLKPCTAPCVLPGAPGVHRRASHRALRRPHAPYDALCSRAPAVGAVAVTPGAVPDPQRPPRAHCAIDRHSQWAATGHRTAWLSAPVVLQSPPPPLPPRPLPRGSVAPKALRHGGGGGAASLSAPNWGRRHEACPGRALGRGSPAAPLAAGPAQRSGGMCRPEPPPDAGVCLPPSSAGGGGGVQAEDGRCFRMCAGGQVLARNSRALCATPPDGGGDVWARGGR